MGPGVWASKGLSCGCARALAAEEHLRDKNSTLLASEKRLDTSNTNPDESNFKETCVNNRFPNKTLLVAGALSMALSGCGGDSDAPEVPSLEIKNSASLLPPLGPNIGISETDCSLGKLGAAISAAEIGEPTGGATVSATAWVAAAGTVPAHCRVDGIIRPVNVAAKPINFAALMPASWNHRSAHLGGGGLNGSIRDLTLAGPSSGVNIQTYPLSLGYITYQSDSGHKSSDTEDWALEDEAVKNLGYMQMKKTHDVTMLITKRMYGELPRFKYYTGASQGGREALTAAQRYHADYDGIVSNVPIVGNSGLSLQPTLFLQRQIAAVNHVPRAKSAAIVAEIMRQCDKLDGIADGVISNYLACHNIFDTTRGTAERTPWAAKLCPGNIDPNPADNSVGACLTSTQARSVSWLFEPYKFATPLANGRTAFGGFTPSIGVGSFFNDTRYVGQENAGPSVHRPSVIVRAVLMSDLNVNALTRYIEGGDLDARRREVSQWIDATDPDVSNFYKKGGKWIMTIGTNDTTAPPGEQMAYYESVLNKMGRNAVDAFARFYVVPQGNHSLGGSNHTLDGDGRTLVAEELPTTFDHLTLLANWVENNVAPSMSAVAKTSSGSKTRPVCSYPQYPHYNSGDATKAESYTCRSN